MITTTLSIQAMSSGMKEDEVSPVTTFTVFRK